MKMSLSFPWLRRALAVAVVASSGYPGAGLAQNEALLPAVAFEDIPATNGSIQQCVVFTTWPGVLYTVEFSHDLASWSTLAEVYGIGQEVVASLREKTAPPPALPGDPPPGEPTSFSHYVSLVLSPASGGGTVVSWRSLAHGGNVCRHIAGGLHPDWETVPLFAEFYDGYQFFVTHRAGLVPLPEDPLLEGVDAAMLEVLEASLPSMNQAVADAAVRSRNSPPPPPPAPGAKAFVRVRVDWGLDSDGDGILDPAEWALQAAGDPYGHPFNGDVDGDGVLDGEVVDSDGDGTPDLFDSSPADPTASGPVLPLPRFALFSLMTGDRTAIQKITDRGEVPYSDGVWAGGQFHQVALVGNGPEDSVITAMNDLGQILGDGHRSWINPQGQLTGALQACVWQDRQASPTWIERQESEGTFMATNTWMWRRLTNDGRFSAISALKDGPAGASSDQLWKLGGGNPTRDGFPLHVTQVADDGIEYGVEGGEGIVYHHGGLLPRFAAFPQNVVVRGGVPMVCFGYKPVLAYRDGSWVPSPTYGDAIDIAVDGTAIGPKGITTQAPVNLNGKWTDLERVAPGLPDGWITEGTAYRDISPAGWILGGKNLWPSWEDFAMLPIRLKGHYINSENETVDQAVGVDDFSIGSFQPDSPPTDENPNAEPNVKDRIWIMVPKGGSKTVEVSAPLSSQSPLTFSAAGITFGGIETAVRVQKQFTLQLSAGENTASGSDLALNLHLAQSSSLSKPVGLKVMKRRTVKVNVYRVTQLREGLPPKSPNSAIIPTDEELSNHLNDVFVPQINVDFDVNMISLPLEVGWDANGDDSLDAGPRNGHSSEQMDVLAHLPGGETVPNIHVFIMGSVVPLDGAQAMTNRQGRTCWIWGNPPSSKANKGSIMHTIAHEIGHVLVGYGHPDQEDSGPAPLPGTNHLLRLLVSGERSVPTSRLLVKGEWDEAEKWLQIEESNGRL